MFNEEWELLTEPELVEAPPLLTLSGMATKEDEFIEARNQLKQRFEKDLLQTEQPEYLSDFVEDVKGDETPNLK